MVIFLKNLISRFVKPQHIVDAGEDVKTIEYNDHICQLEDGKIYLGMITRSRQRKLLEDDDIAPSAISKFFEGVRALYKCATSYALSHLPLDDEVLLNAVCECPEKTAS